MSLAHTRGHLIRAFLEGAAYALYQNFLYVKENGVQMTMPMVVGEGGAKSALWRQIIADVFDIPVAYMEQSKGAPMGNAINAGVGTGVFKDYNIAREWVRFTDRHEPDAGSHATYMKYYGIFERLYPRVKEEYVELAKATGYR